MAANLGEAVALYRAGRLSDAERACLHALGGNRQDFDALMLMGALASERAKWANAQRYFERAVRANAASPHAHHNLGLALRELGRPADALEPFNRAIALWPQFAQAHCNLGAALDDLGRDEEALAAYERAIQIEPGLARAHSNLGGIRQKLRRLEEALRSYGRAIELQPRYAQAWARRGGALLELGRFAEAQASCERAIAIDPKCTPAFINLASVHAVQARFTQALAVCEAWGTTIAEDAALLNARGGVLYLMNRCEEALQSLQKATRLLPDYAEAHWNAALALLKLGRFEEGWKLFEWRKRLARPLGSDPLGRRAWTGRESLSGRTIAVFAEQGLGDAIQLSRYLPLLGKRGARVVLEVPSSLLALFRNLEGVSEVRDFEEGRADVDFACAIMSLPAALRVCAESDLSGEPYLRPDPARVARYAGLFAGGRKFRVGLVWSGGVRPDQPQLAAINLRRNLPLTKLAALDHEAIEFHSLQKGEQAEMELQRLVQQAWKGPVIIDHSARLTDFAETAALLENLDLLISVDTATAHLAGALGKPVWILNRFDGCWRWLRNRSDTPWYASARLYRQSRLGAWDEVVEAVRRDLFSLVAPMGLASTARQAAAG
jgi:tetratricopeptide (TPR) repeat protein